MALLEMPSGEEMVLIRLACALRERIVSPRMAANVEAFMKVVFRFRFAKILSFCDRKTGSGVFLSQNDT
jgi:hypothetical protein